MKKFAVLLMLTISFELSSFGQTTSSIYNSWIKIEKGIDIDLNYEFGDGDINQFYRYTFRPDGFARVSMAYAGFRSMSIVNQ